MQSKKATKLSEIQDAIAFNNPIDNEHPFYTDFTGLRTDFSEDKLYRYLNIIDRDCNPLQKPVKIFLRGHRGTGKTSELLSLKNKIKDTNCYFVIFTDLSEGKLDTNNIEVVDILILLLEDLIHALEKENIEVGSDTLESFYNWYAERISEVNKSVDITSKIKVEGEAKVTIPFFSKLMAQTTASLASTNKTKETVRNVFKPKISDFIFKFNYFILSMKEEFQLKDNGYKDLLFMIDGFEKIGSLENRKKVIIDDSIIFDKIQSNLLMTLPIELFEHAGIIRTYARIIPFSLINIERDEAKIRVEEFILKRVDKDLFENQEVIDEIIKYGAGSPRETLRIIGEIYAETQSRILDMKSLRKVIRVIGEDQVNALKEQDLELLRDIYTNKDIMRSDRKAELLVTKTILEYGSENPKINPSLIENSKFQRLMK